MSVSAAHRASLLVIGGGVGGYTAAIRAAREGLRVTLVERGELGGTCLNEGCIPTKSLLHQAHAFKALQSAHAFGINADSVRLDYQMVDEEKRRVVSQLVGGVRTLIKRNGIEWIQGSAEFIDARTVGVRETGARLCADHIVIATGSRPVLPPIPGMDLPGVMDSAGALALTQLPASVLILGGGVIGVEFAQIFSRFGVTVTLIEQQERLLVQEDPELVEVLQRQLAADTVQCHFNVSVVRLEQMGTQLVASLADGRRLTAEQVLVATGRRPCTEGLCLDRIGLELDSGAIVTNEHGQTSIAHIYAVGDVQGGQLLAHKASAQAEAAVAHLRGHGRGTAGLAIANAVYTSPEMASVGLSEAQARQRHRTVKVGRFPFSANGRALAMKSGQGFVKVIADADTDQILGISMVGPEVTQLLGEATLAVQMELTLSALMETVHAHPTLSEALMEASHDAFNGGAIHLPPRPA